MIIVDNALKFREDIDNPIKVGVVGAGFMSVGLVNQIECHTPGMRAVAICNRTTERAVNCYRKAGVEDVSVCETQSQLDHTIMLGSYAVCNDPEILCASEEVDIIVEATGAIE